MNIFQRIARQIIKTAFDCAVSVIEYFSKMDRFYTKANQLRALPSGTLGKEIANCLDTYHLNLVPKYESHDLKHVLLEYDMTAEDEIRLQAFMLGNGNYTIPSIVIFVFGAILLPDIWDKLYKDFKRGKRTVPIANWTIEKYATHNLAQLRATLSNPIKHKSSIFTTIALTKFGALALIIAGVFGMLFCLPFLFSSNMADLVGAGFPFVAGAILVVGGFLTLSNVSRTRIIN